MAEMQTQMRDLWFRGIEVIAIAQSIASEATEDNDTHFAVHGFVAQLHAKRASQDTHRALDELDRKGFSTGGKCFGYASIEVADERNRDGRPRKRWIVDEQQAAIVRRIFAAYAEGYSLPKIAHRLNAEGVAPPLHGTRHGQIRKAWSTSSIHAMLRNRRYFGEHSWDARQYKKDAKSGKRRSRMRATGKWRVERRDDLRIVPPELEQAVAERSKMLRDRYDAANPRRRAGASFSAHSQLRSRRSRAGPIARVGSSVPWRAAKAPPCARTERAIGRT
jgi:hypothetical protein